MSKMHIDLINQSSTTKTLKKMKKKEEKDRLINSQVIVKDLNISHKAILSYRIIK